MALSRLERNYFSDGSLPEDGSPAGREELEFGGRQIGGELDEQMMRVWRTQGLPAVCPFHNVEKFAYSFELNAWFCPGVNWNECFIYIDNEDVYRGIDGEGLRCACMGRVGSHSDKTVDAGCRGMALPLHKAIDRVGSVSRQKSRR